MPRRHRVGQNRYATRPVPDHDEARPVERPGLISKLLYQIQLCMAKRGPLS
jgi:hypothetical protein